MVVLTIVIFYHLRALAYTFKKKLKNKKQNKQTNKKKTAFHALFFGIEHKQHKHTNTLVTKNKKKCKHNSHHYLANKNV